MSGHTQRFRVRKVAKILGLTFGKICKKTVVVTDVGSVLGYAAANYLVRKNKVCLIRPF